MKAIIALFQKYRYPLAVVLVARAGYSLWLLIIWLIVDRYFQSFDLFIRETYKSLTPSSTIIGRGLLDVWLRWDAVHYMNLARYGYSITNIGDFNYPPLYPYLTGIIARLTIGNVVLAGLLLSTIATLVTFILLMKLIDEFIPMEGLAKETILIIAIYPTSYFLFGPYTDALYLGLSVATFLALKRKKWVITGLLISLASLARIQGVLLLIPFAIEAIMAGNISVRKIKPSVVVGFLLASFGILLLSLWRNLHQISLYHQSFESYSNIILVNPLTGLYLAIDQFIQTHDLLVLSEIISILLFTGILIWMIFKPLFRRQYALLSYGFALLLLFMAKHSIAASALQSANRYVLSIFPAYIGLAAFTLGMPQQWRKAYIVACLCISCIAISLYALWVFTG